MDLSGSCIRIVDILTFSWVIILSPQINVTVEVVVYDFESLESDTTLGILQYRYIGQKIQNKSITTLPGSKQLEWVKRFLLNLAFLKWKTIISKYYSILLATTAKHKMLKLQCSTAHLILNFIFLIAG